MNGARRWRLTRALVLLAVIAGACGENTAPVRPASVTVSMSAIGLAVGPSGGQTFQLHAMVRDAKGGELPTIPIEWSVVGAANVSVSTTGLVTAVSEGAATVRASGGGHFGDVAVIVSPVAVAALAILEDEIALERSVVGVESYQARVTLHDSTGALLTGRTVAWHTSDPSIAQVSATGLVTPWGNGTTTLRATSGVRTDTAIIRVTTVAGLPAAADLRIDAVRFSQGAQDDAGSIPMLRNGRNVVAMVGTTSNVTLADPVDFEFRLFNAGGALIWADTITKPVPLGATATAASPIQFLIPSALLEPGVRWQVVRDPNGTLADANATNDRHPEPGHAPLDLITPPPIRLRFVAIQLTSNGGTAPVLNASAVTEYLTLFRSFIPHGEFEYSIAPNFAFSTSFGIAPAGGDDAFWVALLPALDAARVADPDYADAYWIGVVLPPPGFSWVVYGGFGYVPSSGASFAPGTRTFAFIGRGWFSNHELSKNLFVHELGHTLGRRHAPCGGAAGADPAYPFADGRVGVGAHHTYWWDVGAVNGAAPVNPTTRDFMGYCEPIWISAHNYKAIVQFRGSIDAAAMAPRVRGRVLLVQGNIAGDSATIGSTQAMTAHPTADEQLGSWRADVLDATGGVLRSVRFEPARWDHLPTLRPFGVTIALSGDDEARMDRVRVTGPAGTSTLRTIDR